MDFQTILVIVVIVLLLAYIINRNQGAGNGQGNQSPRYDDPNIDGRGSFGRDRDNQSPTQRIRSNQDSRPSNSGHNDPNVEGHGSFGRDKD